MAETPAAVTDHGPATLTPAPPVVRRFQVAASSAATQRAYKTDWMAFTAWCSARSLIALPADPMTVARYLAETAELVDTSGRFRYSPSTLSRRLAAINKAHALANKVKPGAHSAVSTTMAGIRRERATPPVRKEPLLLPPLRRVLQAIDVNRYPAGIIGQRDWAILLFGFVGAYRRSELAALTLADVTRHEHDGLHVRTRRSKTDQEGHGATKGLPFGSDPATCAPCAFARWVRVLAAASGTQAAMLALLRETDTAVHVCRQALPELATLDAGRPLFRALRKGGHVLERGISGDVVNDVVHKRVGAIGLDSPAFGGHSLRAGFVTEALRAGADHHQVMRQTGHKTPAMVETYSRDHDPLAHNAVTRLAL